MKTNNTTKALQFNFSHNLNKLFNRLLFMLVTGLLISTSTFSQTKDFTLRAIDNVKSANSDGTIYFMEISNNSDEDMMVRLCIFNKNAPLNPDKTESKNNVYLEATFLNDDGEEIEGLILLKAKELYKFHVKIIVPEGTPFDRWNNLRLHATYDKFPKYSNSLTLFTYVSNENEIDW